MAEKKKKKEKKIGTGYKKPVDKEGGEGSQVNADGSKKEEGTSLETVGGKDAEEALGKLEIEA